MFKMADIRAKRERKIPKRFIDDFVEAEPKNLKKKLIGVFIQWG